MTVNIKELLTRVIVLGFALTFLFVGNRIANEGVTLFQYFDDMHMHTVEARVTEIVDVYVDEGAWGSLTTITFEARTTGGERRHSPVTAIQNHGFAGDLDRGVAIGDRVILIEIMDGTWHFMDFVRINNLLVLGVIFVVLLLLFGRTKGLNALISLGLTCVAIFAVFVPSILSGRNIHVWAIVVCLYSIIVTLFLVYGINKKSIAALTGCIGGVIAASVITVVMNRVLMLSGLLNEESMHLLFLPTEYPIDLIGIIFAGIIIGAVGAVIDVAVSIASAMWELKEQAPDIPFSKMLQSGINVGKDIMGSMTNTLVLAYIGGSLSVILLLIVYATSFMELMNREMVVVEILQAVVGSMGILLTMPLTALVCAFLFVKKPN